MCRPLYLSAYGQTVNGAAVSVFGHQIGHTATVLYGLCGKPPISSVPPLRYDNYYQFRLASSFPRRTYTT